MNRIPHLRGWLGLGISLVFLYLAFRGQDMGQIWEAVRRVDYRYLIPAILVYVAGVGVRALRWSVLLRGIGRLRLRDVFEVVVIGYMANNVLPLRAGEIVRAYALSRRPADPPVRPSSTLATIAVERTMDGLTMLGFILVAALSIGLTTEIRHVALVAVLVFGLLIAGLFTVSAGPVRRWTVGQLLPRLPDRLATPVGHTLAAFLDGLATLRRRDDIVMVGLTSITAWLLEATLYFLIGQGFGLGIGPSVVLLTTAIANLATLIPSSPGYLGPFEAAVVLVLTSAAGVQREVALSYAIVVHAALYIPITLWGFVYWWRASLSWREARKLAVEEAGTQ